MDNGARALIMAASVLLGVLLLSSLVYVLRKGASIDEAYDAQQSTYSLELFNSKFEVYDGYDVKNTITDINTLANLTYNVNNQYDYDEKKSVEMIVKINNKYFEIPDMKAYYNNNDKSISYFDDTQAVANKDSYTSVGRNMIISVGSLPGRFVEHNTSGSKAISIYDLQTKSLKDLGVEINNNDDISYLENDSLSKTVLTSSSTIYKYIFSVECICEDEDGSGISYHIYSNSSSTGRVRKIELNCLINPDYISYINNHNS